jgi:hypothetical protein
MTTRSIQTTYYGPGKGRKKPVVKVTHGSNRHEILPNIMRRLTQNLDGAVVVEAIDLENHNELLAVVTMWPGDQIRTVLKGDVTRPIFATHFKE